MVDDLVVAAVAGGPDAPGPLQARLVVGPAHPLLAGHFPGAPLVPGVLLLEAVRRAWERASGCQWAIVAVDDARWFAPVAPGAEVTLQAAAAPGPGGVSITGEWRGTAGRVATFTVRLAAAVADPAGATAVAPGPGGVPGRS